MFAYSEGYSGLSRHQKLMDKTIDYTYHLGAIHIIT